MSARRARLRGEGGQSALELMMTIGVIFFLMLALMQVSLICSTKLISNYAAWISARVWAVNEDDALDKADQAGMAVLEILQWQPISSNFITVQPGNEGAWVEYETTLGIPFILENNSAGRITIEAWGAVPLDPNGFAEKGDNRER